MFTLSDSRICTALRPEILQAVPLIIPKLVAIHHRSPKKSALNLICLPLGIRNRSIVTTTWKYYLANPEFITLVNSENLHKAKHLKKSEVIHTLSRRFINMVGALLERGVAEGVFRPGIDPVRLNITIAAINHYHLTNRFTGSIIFERNLLAPEALDERINFNIGTIMRLVCKNGSVSPPNAQRPRL